MNQVRKKLSHTWQHIQSALFPMIQEELGELTKKQMQWVQVLEVAQLEAHIPSARGYPGRPTECRVAMARAFTAKAVYNMSTTRMLLDRLESDLSMRRICGWERKADVPSEATFSRAFDEFATSHLAERVHQAIIRVHQAIIKECLGKQIVGHISRDATAINAREKPEKQSAITKKPKKRGRPKKGEERPKVLTRLEKSLMKVVE